jgi:hypothetical protein
MLSLQERLYGQPLRLVEELTMRIYYQCKSLARPILTIVLDSILNFQKSAEYLRFIEAEIA